MITKMVILLLVSKTFHAFLVLVASALTFVGAYDHIAPYLESLF